MSGTADLDVLKDIPGYKAILKSVIKTQIQMLVEQLAQHTEEESIILTASVNDGTLSHLGSGTGKGFLEGREEIKSQFLGYCLKSHHRKKTQEPVNKPSPYPRTSVPQPSPRSSMSHPVPAKRPRIHPVSMTRINQGPGDGLSPGVSTGELIPRSIHSPSQNYTPGVRNVQESVQIGSVGIAKIEPPSDPSDNTFNGNSLTLPTTSTPISLPSSLQLSHTQTSASAEDSNAPGFPSASGDNDSNSGSVSNIKVEPITEGEMELEITGVEMGDSSGGAWGQNLTAEQMGYQSSGGDDSLGQAGDQSGYMNQPVLQPTFPFEPISTGNPFVQGVDGNYTEDATGVAQQFQNAFTESLKFVKMGKFNVYECPLCGKRFGDKTKASVHSRVHSSARPFKCRLCDKAYKHNGDLKVHMRSRHGVSS